MLRRGLGLFPNTQETTRRKAGKEGRKEEGERGRHGGRKGETEKKREGGSKEEERKPSNELKF